MKIVYSVESGCYSDYVVHALFSSRERAEAYIKWHAGAKDGDNDGDNGYWISEWIIDEPYEDKGSWRVYVYADGRVKWGPDWRPDEPANIEARKVKVNDDMLFVGYGKTPEHARRSAEELRRAWVVTQPAP